MPWLRQAGIDRQRPEQGGAAIAGHDGPQAHGADHRVVAVAIGRQGDEAQAVERRLAVAQALAGLLPALRTEGVVEQPLDGGCVGRPLGSERDHRETP